MGAYDLYLHSVLPICPYFSLIIKFIILDMAGVFNKSFMFRNALLRNSLISQTSFFSTSSARYDTVGFIGLGNMGGHMANNLIKGGRDRWCRVSSQPRRSRCSM